MKSTTPDQDSRVDRHLLQQEKSDKGKEGEGRGGGEGRAFPERGSGEKKACTLEKTPRITNLLLKNHRQGVVRGTGGSISLGSQEGGKGKLTFQQG